MLSDQDIYEYLTRGDLKISPLYSGSIQPSSVDLHLDSKFLWPVHRMDGFQVMENDEDEWYNHEEPWELVIVPGDLVLASTVEEVQLPDFLAGQMVGKSSLGRKGLCVTSACSHVDPGFRGKLTLELWVASRYPVTVKPGCSIVQLLFWELKTPCKEPYNGKYQYQKLPTYAKEAA